MQQRCLRKRDAEVETFSRPAEAGLWSFYIFRPLRQRLGSDL